MTSVIVSIVRLSILLTGFVAITYGAGPGFADPTFNTAAYGAVSGTVVVAARQSDGKILIAGAFSDINGRGASSVARLNADGTVDPTFVPPDFYSQGSDPGTISSLGIQSDGKIVVGGNYLDVDGDSFGRGMRRLNPDGSLDTTFNVMSLLGGHTVREIAIQPDDKILLGGSSSPGPGLLVRLNADGTVDQGFSNPGVGAVFSMLVQSDGKILVSGHGTVKRLEANGAFDNSFASLNMDAATVLDMCFRPDGKILIVGAFSTINGTPVGGVALLSQNGTPDFTFNQSNAGANFAVSSIELLADGKVLIGGSFTAYNAVERQHVARLNADGTLDTAFVNNTSLFGTQIQEIAVLNDGRILVADGLVQVGPTAVLLNSDGSTDGSIEYVISSGGRVRRICLLVSGKIIIAGDFNYVNGVKRRGLARLNPDGTLDTSFVPYFNSSTVDRISLNSVVEQPDGKLLVGGINGFIVQRLNENGSQDTGFATTLNSASTVYDIELLPSGEVIIVGTLTDGIFTRRVVRLMSNGQIDTSFTASVPNADVYCVVRQPDGKLLIGGDFTSLGLARGRVARLNQDGAVDESFDTSVGAAGTVFNIALQADGKVIVGGAFLSLNGSNSRVRIGRLNANGTLDSGFAQSIDGVVVALMVQRDGRILVGGGFDSVGGVLRARLARLNANGSLDTSFSSDIVNPVVDIRPQMNGRILIGGEFTRVNGKTKLRIARILNSITPFDFDGDGRADVSVFRPSTGTWWELFSSDSQFGQFAFGLSDDIPAPADFDGDGRTDEAIFRPSTGDFWYASSIGSSAVNKHWGQAGDVPRPSDFDGDGLADFIVYRPSNSIWYRYGSTGQISIAEFGISGDVPLTGDFDGDGRTDLAVFRPSTGDWWYAASGSNNQPRSLHWGVTGDLPAPADYDGDGKTDFAVFRPANGVWYVFRSSDLSYTIVAFGLGGDRPVPADYDGDGLADIAIFRPSTGIWYLMQTTSGTSGVQWGVASDVAVPNAFIPQ